MNAEIAVTLMEELGLQIDRGKDGIRYVSAIEQKPAGTYDLILMDIQMPNMGGYKATQIIRGFSDKEKANIPIVAMTANAFEGSFCGNECTYRKTDRYEESGRGPA